MWICGNFRSYRNITVTGMSKRNLHYSTYFITLLKVYNFKSYTEKLMEFKSLQESIRFCFVFYSFRVKEVYLPQAGVMLLNTTPTDRTKKILQALRAVHFTACLLLPCWIHFRSLSLRSLREHDWCGPTTLNAYGYYAF